MDGHDYLRHADQNVSLFARVAGEACSAHAATPGVVIQQAQRAATPIRLGRDHPWRTLDESRIRMVKGADAPVGETAQFEHTVGVLLRRVPGVAEGDGVAVVANRVQITPHLQLRTNSVETFEAALGIRAECGEASGLFLAHPQSNFSAPQLRSKHWLSTDTEAQEHKACAVGSTVAASGQASQER